MRGYKGFSGTLGHEFVGEVIDGPDAWLGKRVVGEINISCGECDLCRRGMRTHCRNRATLGLMNYDGAFADVFRLPVDNLWAVPDGVSDEQAVFAEPLAAACEVLEAGVIAPETRAIVLGAGKLGLLWRSRTSDWGGPTVVARRDSPASLLAQWGFEARPAPDLDRAWRLVIDCTGSAEGSPRAGFGAPARRDHSQALTRDCRSGSDAGRGR